MCRLGTALAIFMTILAAQLGIRVDAAVPHPSGITFLPIFAPDHGLTNPTETPFRQEVCLNGLWQFEPLALPRGYKAGGGPPALPAANSHGWSATPIRIPSPWNVDSFASGNGDEFDCFPSYPKSWNSVQMGWLKTDFSVPIGWKGKQIYLHFMSIIGAADIVVNGHQLANHFNNFLPFRVDVSRVVRIGGRNTLLVGVRKPDLFNIRGPLNSKYTYPTGSFWGMHVVGIDQDVFLQARPKLYIKNVFIRPLVQQGVLRVDVTVVNRSKTGRHFNLVGKIRPWKWLDSNNEITAPASKSVLGSVVLRVNAPPVTLAAGQTQTFNLSVRANHVLALWTLIHPRLYGLIVSLRAAHKTLDRKYDRFGWRQWSISGKQLLLNGKPVKLYADAWHFLGVPAMTPRYAWAWFTMLKKAHCNAVRLHAQPRPPFFLKLADQMGIAVLDESGIWASHCGFNYWQDATWRRFRRGLQAQVLRDRNHPSIFGWSVANEIYAAMYVVHAPKSVQAMVTGKVVDLAHMVEKLDPTRPWVSSDGDGDMNGRLPVYIAHYGTPRDWAYHARVDKPFAVGECTETYYSTPPMVAKLEGDRAYKNMKYYMQGLAIQAYQDAIAERKLCAYGALWNLVWYGLKPLPLGLRDQKVPATLRNGIFFGRYVPHQPGMQPERLGPYCSTLNPGYDPRLPLFEPWSLWKAVQAARAPGHALPSPWSKAPAQLPLPHPLAPVIRHVRFAGSIDGRLGTELAALGASIIPIGIESPGRILIVDLLTVRPDQMKNIDANIRSTCDRGGIVLIFNLRRTTLKSANALLPVPLALTNRAAVSLLADRHHGLTAPISLAALYFGADHNAYIIRHGMSGTFVKRSKILLRACPVNWLAWTKKPEYLKTACLFISQHLKKPSGAALVQYPLGSGHLDVTTLDVLSSDPRKLALLKALLENLRIVLRDNAANRYHNGPKPGRFPGDRPLK